MLNDVSFPLLLLAASLLSWLIATATEDWGDFIAGVAMILAFGAALSAGLSASDNAFAAITRPKTSSVANELIVLPTKSKPSFDYGGSN